MHKFVRNTLLKYVPEDLYIEKTINPARIFEINHHNIKSGYVIYLCEREIRIRDNFALQFGIQKSKELNLPLIVIHPKIRYEYKPKQIFIDAQISQTQKLYEKLGIDFYINNNAPSEILKKINTSVLIIDFNPILNRNYLKNAHFDIYEIDGHNIIPARFISNKQEYSAATIRRKIYLNISEFLTESKNFTEEKTESDYILKDFIKNRLPFYAEHKNNPEKDVISNLSKYINLGFISSRRVAIEIIKSNVDVINKESFLEEIIVRKELADNFCLYANNFKDFSSIPNWAKISLKHHKHDIRPVLYSLKTLEQAKTHDKLWNASQNELIKTGKIHGYLRMYWAKKILEWTFCPEKALDFAIYLNDKYAYDSPSSNGYTGILWAIGGLHDRAFADYPVTGKIRRMTFDSIKRKFDIETYIKTFE